MSEDFNFFDDEDESLEKHGIVIKASAEEIWHRGSVSYWDFFTKEVNDELIYRVVIPKGSPLQIYLAKTYPEIEAFQLTEDEILESNVGAEDLICKLNSIGYDVVEIPAEYYDIMPTTTKISWSDSKGNEKLIEGWKYNKLIKEEYKGQYATSKAITWKERSAKETEMENILLKQARNTDKRLN
jgi:hypothetical protein